MKIISLTAENFKRLVAVSITPDGNMVEIAGRNGQGKTSILDAIWVALSGLSNAPSQPIRNGELESRIVLHLGSDKPELVVTRTFRPKKDQSEIVSKLTVESADGAQFPSPQAVLDKLLGALSFDPLAFERMDAKAQFNTLRAFVPGVDFDAIDRDNRGDYDRRATLNRKAKEARAAASAIKVDPSLPADAVDASALVAKLDEAGKFNTDIETRKSNREKMAQKVADLKAGSESLFKLIDELQAKINEAKDGIQSNEKLSAELQAKLDGAPPLPEPIDTAPIRAQINSASAVNDAIRDRQQRDTLVKQATEFESQAEELTLSMDQREVQKRKAIAEAKLPVDGIEFGDNEILFKGVPFAQASDAERLTVSISIAMAMNPTLRVIRVRDGSLLDDRSMAVLASMADERDYQVWIERVDSTGKVGIVIEDGKVLTSSDK